MKNNRSENKFEFSTWVHFAEEDYLSAKVLFEEEIYNQVCFHAQQSVEKMLKAFFSVHSLFSL